MSSSSSEEDKAYVDMTLEVHVDPIDQKFYYLTTWLDEPEEGGDWLNTKQIATLSAIKAHENHALLQLLTNAKNTALTTMKKITAKQLKKLKKKHKIRM